MSFSDYLEGKVLDFVFRANPDSFASPSTVYVGLLTSAPTESDATGSLSEVSGTGYARQSATFSSPTTQGTTKQVVTSGDITFPEAGSTWGTVSHIAIYDASTSGNWLCAVNLTDSGGSTTTKTISSGDVFKISAGNLKVSLD